MRLFLCVTAFLLVDAFVVTWAGAKITEIFAPLLQQLGAA